MSRPRSRSSAASNPTRSWPATERPSITIVIIIVVMMDVMMCAGHRMRVVEVALGGEVDVEIDVLRHERVGQRHLPDQRVAVKAKQAFGVERLGIIQQSLKGERAESDG